MFVAAAMDVMDGSCVRLTKGDYASKRTYASDPVEIARYFADSGLKRLHFVDLDGAKAGHVVNYRILERIAVHTPLFIDVGGGLQSEKDFETVFGCGAHQATIGSLAVHNRLLTLQLLKKWGAQKLILGADCKEGYIAVSGWTETTAVTVADFIASYLREGFYTVISTEISRDGMLCGPATALYESLLDEMKKQQVMMELIASGGIRSLDDLNILSTIGLGGAIVGKALYEGAIKAEQLAGWEAGQWRDRC